MISHERLKELLHYNPETGVFTRRVRTSNSVRAGDTAGSLHCFTGYWQISINHKRYLAHRLAWLYVHGVWPKNQIDHINGVRDDNRLANLREATNAENQHNRAKHPKNTSGFPGVCRDSARKKWMARITVNKMQRHLGRFDSPEAAHTAYLAAKAKLHAFSPNIRESNHVQSK